MKFIASCLIFFLLTSCQVRRPSGGEALCIEEATFRNLPGWEKDDLRPAFLAFKRSCYALKKQERSKRMGLSMTVGIWHDACDKANKVSYKDAKAVRSFFEDNFTPYKCRNQDKDDLGLYTGYYESELHGSFTRSDQYQYPLYKRPPDLIKKDNKYGRKGFFSFSPHHDRASIDKGALDGKKLELVWVDSDVDAFFLHVQGSGRIRLSDGRHVRVGYDGANGHAYTSIGKILIERGEVTKEDMSMQAIRQWIAKNPKEGRKLMQENASYVFFKQLEDHGAIGAQGIPVATGRTLAVDKRFIPYGVPIWLDIIHDENKVNLQRLVIAQDTGGAIRGALRGDVFWGFGDLAAKVAGQMKAKGRSYLILPKRVPFSGCYRG